MDKTSLGENKDAPGAARRECAQIKRDFVKASQALVYKKSIEARRHITKANLYSRCSQLVHLNTQLHLTDELNKTAGEYRALELDHVHKSLEIESEIKELEEKIFKNKWGARKDSTIAFYQTMKAKIFN